MVRTTFMYSLVVTLGLSQSEELKSYNSEFCLLLQTISSFWLDTSKWLGIEKGTFLKDRDLLTHY